MREQQRILVLGRMPRDADPRRCLAAGPWCFAGQEQHFPGWETSFAFAPDPTDTEDTDIQNRISAQAKTLCADTLPAIAASLCPHSRQLPASYWETLLTPWAINVSKQIIERWWRVKALVQSLGENTLHVPLLPADCVFAFDNGPDYILRGALGHEWNHWLFSRLLEPVFPRSWSREYLPRVTLPALIQPSAGPREKARHLLRRLSLHLPCPHLKGMSLAQSVLFSLALVHRSHGPDKATPQSWYGSAAHGMATDLPASLTANPLPLFLPSLPRDLALLRHPAHLVPDPRGPRLRIASVLAYEDVAYRQDLACWRGRGNRLMYVQHGSDYGQVRTVTDVELVEYGQHAFGTWGWKTHGACRGNFIPLPYPQLHAQRHLWQGSRGQNLLVVGTEMSAFPYRLDGHPSPLQMLNYREDKARFFHTLPPSLRRISFYRPYFPVPGTLNDAPWLRERFPEVRQATGTLAQHLRTCRLLVLDHNGTTLLEAIAAGIPTVAFWRREAWPLTGEAEKLLDILAEVGIWQSTPEEAARRVTSLWADPLLWWQSEAVRHARAAYSSCHALLMRGSPVPTWLRLLKRL